MSGSSIATVVLEDLRSLLGGENVRTGTAQDAIDGVQPSYLALPGSVDEVAGALATAAGAGLTVLPTGHGTKLSWGNVPERCDILLGMSRMGRVLEHAAGDLIVRAEAGATLESVQDILARGGQKLMLDPPEESATLGGIVAANASGPLRLRYGTVRDMLIGITYVLPDGTIARAGGKVVKNVAGYDLCKLFTGSFGTLGVVAETIFRVHPVTAARRFVQVQGLTMESVREAVQVVTHSVLVPSALEMGWNGTARLIALFEGTEAGVTAQAQGAVRMWEPLGTTRMLADEEGRETLSAESYRLAGVPERITLKISALPGDITAVLRDVHAAGVQRFRHQIWGHAAIGITWVDLAGERRYLVEYIDQLRQRIGARGGSVVLRRAPRTIKQEVDAWGPVGDALPLMRTVKARFDPGRTMVAGRFVGGL